MFYFSVFHIYLYCVIWHIWQQQCTNGYVQSVLRYKCGHCVMNCECQCKWLLHIYCLSLAHIYPTSPKYISYVIFTILIFYSSLMTLYSAEQLQHLETSTTKTMKSGLTATNLPSICPSDRKCRRLFEFTSVPLIWV